MLRLVTIGFVVAMAFAAEAMPITPAREMGSVFTIVREACGAGMHRVNGVCVRRCPAGMRYVGGHCIRERHKM
jgi:hypothetical protein